MAYRGRHINPRKFERGQIKILVILLPLALFMALPIVFIVCHAFKPMEELFAFPPRFFVQNPTLDNYTKLIKFSRSAGIPLTRYLFNSLVVTVLSVGLERYISVIRESTWGANTWANWPLPSTSCIYSTLV